MEMIRTIISLEAEQKAWLDGKARELGKPMTAVVRDAVARLQAEDAQKGEPSLDDLLERTRGLWKRGDGLAWQRKVRSQWSRR